MDGTVTRLADSVPMTLYAANRPFQVSFIGTRTGIILKATLQFSGYALLGAEGSASIIHCGASVGMTRLSLNPAVASNLRNSDSVRSMPPSV
jgi:hypothetical protein